MSVSTLRVRGQCEHGFPQYKYFCRKFTDAASRLKKWTGNTKLKNELLTELEDLSLYFTQNELEIVVYMSDEDEWKSIRAKFLSSAQAANNRVSLREESVTISTTPSPKVLWELLERDLYEGLKQKQKSFLCVLASRDRKKLSSIARELSGSFRPVVKGPGIVFLDTQSDKNLSLSELSHRDRNFEFPPPTKISQSPEVDSLYARVDSVLKTRIETFLQQLLKFVQGNLPSSGKGQSGEVVDLYDLDKMELDYVEERKMMWKTMFEAHTWAQCMKINIQTGIPEVPKLLEDLQMALLSLKGVEGCGTIWGRLTLHVAAEKMLEIPLLVPGILQKHGYKAGYRIHEFLKQEMQAGPGIIAGAQLSTKLTEEGKRKLAISKKNIGKDPQDIGKNKDTIPAGTGTLGCFVSGRKVTGNPQAAVTTDLYAVTCAHCIEDCEGDIEAKDSYDMFRKISCIGTDTVKLYENDGIDIAAIKVNKGFKQSCILNMGDDGKNDKTLATGDPEWRIFSEKADSVNLMSLHVFKKGSVTNLTHGIIICNDYITAKLKARGKPFDEMYNILIEVTQDAPPVSDSKEREKDEAGSAGATCGAGATGATGGSSPNLQGATAKPRTDFSEAGDSGAAVCGELTSSAHLQVISILGGSISTKQGDVEYECSYSTLLKPSLDELGKKEKIMFSVPGI